MSKKTSNIRPLSFSTDLSIPQCRKIMAPLSKDKIKTFKIKSNQKILITGLKILKSKWKTPKTYTISFGILIDVLFRIKADVYNILNSSRCDYCLSRTHFNQAISELLLVILMCYNSTFKILVCVLLGNYCLLIYSSRNY